MKIAVVILSVLLITSNAYWLYPVIDCGITLSYRDDEVYELNETRKQLMAMLPEVAKNVTKEEIVAVAVVAVAGEYTDQEVFEKEGCTWVGWLGFKFDEANKLKSVSPSSSLYDEKNPCHPAF